MFLPNVHVPLSAGYVLASLFSCNPAAGPAVTVEFRNNPPEIVNAQSTASLKNLKKDSVSPSYGSEFPNLDGLTKGVIDFKYDLDFTDTEQPALGKVCVQTKEAHVVVTYTPTVYISNSSTPGSCRYNTTLEHEMRHVGTDVAAIKEFMPYIRTHAAVALAPPAHLQPIDMEAAGAEQESRSKKVSEVLEDASRSLQQVRTSRQREIDSHAEYERLSRACSGERR